MQSGLALAYSRWQSPHSWPGPVPSIESCVFAIAWLLWHWPHSGQLCSSNACLCLLPSNKLALAEWQRLQLRLTCATPGGLAAWLPWQVLHAGAPRSPRTSNARPCTLSRYSASCVVGSGEPSARVNPAMTFGSAWHAPQVSGTCCSYTFDCGSFAGRMP